MDSPEISFLTAQARALLFFYQQMFKKQIFLHGFLTERATLLKTRKP